jgi:hypothetical protein
MMAGTAALPGLLGEVGRGALQKIRELSPEDLRGRAAPQDTTVVDAASALARRVAQDPGAAASKVLDYGRGVLSSPGNVVEFLGENITPRPRGPTSNRKDIFIGKSAKTWDAAAAKRAEEMEKLGASPEDIWRETGTFRGPEGALRQEISDLEATGIFTHLPPSKERRSVSALRHPEFAEAYPEFASISQTGLRSPATKGEFQRASGRGSPETGSIIAQAPNEDALASTMLHEFQHAVQDLEGFAPGGSPRDFRQRAMPRDVKEIAFKKDMREMAISQKLQEAGFPVSKGKMVSVSHPKVMKAAKELAEVDPQVKKYLDDIEEFNEALKLFPTPQQQYVRLAGEAEARAVEARKKMTPEERRSTFPYESYDVQTNRLIIKR